jgi:hypothetical protein
MLPQKMNLGSHDQIIMTEDGLENKLTEIWEAVSGGLIESVFDQ